MLHHFVKYEVQMIKQKKNFEERQNFVKYDHYAAHIINLKKCSRKILNFAEFC